jgi:hypothetical protein
VLSSRRRSEFERLALPHLRIVYRLARQMAGRDGADGIEAPCRRIGHHGAIATADGHIWNLVDQKTASDLIHNEQLLGRHIVVHGRVFRGARTLVVESYQFQS